jgi:hypothetical protein
MKCEAAGSPISTGSSKTSSIAAMDKQRRQHVVLNFSKVKIYMYKDR